MSEDKVHENYPVNPVKGLHRRVMAWEMVCPDSRLRGIQHFLIRPKWNEEKVFHTYLFCELCQCFWKITKRGL